MSDEGLREAYQRVLATRAPRERSVCPAPDAILALVRREGSEDGRLSVLDHAMACPACRKEFELLRAIEGAGAQAAREEAARKAAGGSETPGRVVGHISWRRWAPLAAAAALVLAVALGPGRRVWQRAPDPVRGGGEALTLIAPAEGTTPAAAPIAFTWHPLPGAERYTLELLTAGGMVAFSRTTADTALTIALPATLAPGDYSWWVTARGADGSETRSGTRTVRLRGR